MNAIDDEKQIYEYPDGTKERLGWTEACEAGFCPMCGYFVAGSEDDRTLISHGVCVECLDDLKHEVGEYDDDYYEDADGIGY